jgi:hypothetical protein
MPPITDLNELLASMAPHLNEGEYVFCSLQGEYGDYLHLNPITAFRETEGLSLVIPKQSAIDNNISTESTYRMITLTVHSSLEAVGLTAAVATKLTDHNISANVIAAFHHDHILVQTEKAEMAMNALSEIV